MKAKQKKETSLNSILGVNLGLPSLSETGIAVMNAENVIAAYEKQAADILKRDGYPLTFNELWNKKDELLPDLANGKGLAQVYSIFWMLWGLNMVRIDIEKNDVDAAVWHTAYALNWAIKAQLKPIASFFEMGKVTSQTNKIKRGKRQRWRKLTPSQREELKQKVKLAFATRKGTANAFYKKYAKKSGLSASGVRYYVES